MSILITNVNFLFCPQMLFQMKISNIEKIFQQHVLKQVYANSSSGSGWEGGGLPSEVVFSELFSNLRRSCQEYHEVVSDIQLDTPDKICKACEGAAWDGRNNSKINDTYFTILWFRCIYVELRISKSWDEQLVFVFICISASTVERIFENYIFALKIGLCPKGPSDTTTEERFRFWTCFVLMHIFKRTRQFNIRDEIRHLFFFGVRVLCFALTALF